jgi:hypothetical protein
MQTVLSGARGIRHDREAIFIGPTWFSMVPVAVLGALLVGAAGCASQAEDGDVAATAPSMLVQSESDFAAQLKSVETRYRACREDGHCAVRAPAAGSGTSKTQSVEFFQRATDTRLHTEGFFGGEGAFWPFGCHASSSRAKGRMPRACGNVK